MVMVMINMEEEKLTPEEEVWVRNTCVTHRKEIKKNLTEARGK